jgi:hypothetical protein
LELNTFDTKTNQAHVTRERIGSSVVSVMLKQITRTEGRNSTTVQTFLHLLPNLLVLPLINYFYGFILEFKEI